jgi:hypothetical protein
MFSCDPVAIDAESEGDYLKASNLLLDLIEQSSEEVGYTEVSMHYVDAWHDFVTYLPSLQSNIWEQERLRCLEKMALWDDLALNVMIELEEDVEALWESETQVTQDR